MNLPIKLGAATLVALLFFVVEVSAYECSQLNQRRAPDWVERLGQNSTRSPYVYGYARNQISPDISLVELEADLKARALEDLVGNIEVTVQSASETKQVFRDNRGNSQFKSTNKVNSGFVVRNLSSTEHYINERTCTAYTRVGIDRDNFYSLGKIERDPIRTRSKNTASTLGVSYNTGTMSYKVGDYREGYCRYSNYTRRTECVNSETTLYSVNGANFDQLGLHMLLKEGTSNSFSILITNAEHPHGISEWDYEKIELELFGFINSNTSLWIGLFEDTNLEAGIYFGAARYRWFSDQLGAFIGFALNFAEDKHAQVDDFYDDEESSDLGGEISVGLKYLLTDTIAFEIGQIASSSGDYEERQSYLSLGFQF